MLLYCLLSVATLLPDTAVLRKQLPVIEVNSEKQAEIKSLEPQSMVGSLPVKISMDNRLLNLNSNQARQIFASVPGVQVWEQDGNQVAIAYRGLSPNRSWEIGMRQQMMPVSADPYGYPESYYAPPFEAISTVDIIRSGNSLLYGPQAGGMINYRIRNIFDKTFSGRASLQYGSFGQKTAFLQLTANKKGWNLNTFFSHRASQGFRPFSGYNSQNAYIALARKQEKYEVQISATFFNLLAQQPGGLTDSMFVENMRQSTRSRNWLCVQGLIPGISAAWHPNSQCNLQLQASGFAGGRHSVGFVAPVTTQDQPGSDGQYAYRQVDRDFYGHYTIDLRGKYQLRKVPVALLAGITHYKGNIYRKQLGKGDRGNNYSLELLSPYGRDLDLFTGSVAAYFSAEIKFARRWQASAGVRQEQISSSAFGRTGFVAGSEVLLKDNVRRGRSVTLPFAGVSYATAQWKFFGNLSGFYRPVLYSELIPLQAIDTVSPDLRDAGGYQAEAGVAYKNASGFSFQVTLFNLNYQNKIGSYQYAAPGGPVRQLKTNIGASNAYGLEVGTDYTSKWGSHSQFSAFAAATLMKAYYLDYTISRTVYGIPVLENNRGKKLENAPATIARLGMEYRYHRIRAGVQMAYTEKAFSDAVNTLQAPANAQIGIIPAYAVTDVFAGSNLGKFVELDAGISNVFNRQYFTRRSSGYPGPGIIPADPRNFFVRLKVNW
jgi:Fe(3+) dicitrate transport protein